MKRRLRWPVLVGLALVTLSCQLVLGLDEPIVVSAEAAHRDDGGALEAGEAGEAGDDAAPTGPDECIHAFPPPLPSDAGADVDADAEAGVGRSYWFAVQELRVPKEGELVPRGFDLDRTCSCDPTAGESGTRLSCTNPSSDGCDTRGAGGIDDSLDRLVTGLIGLGKEDLSPLKVATTEIGLGRRTMLVYVSGWNGETNDPEVQVQFVNSRGIFEPGACADGGVDREAIDDRFEPRPTADATRYGPKFDGCDRWWPNGDLDSKFPNRHPTDTRTGYVSKGLIVVGVDRIDTQLFGRTTTVRDGYFVGQILPVFGQQSLSQLKGVLTGRVAYDDLAKAIGSTQLGNKADDGTFTQVCEDPATWALTLAALCSARDVMIAATDDFTNGSCNAVSLSLGFSAIEAQVADTGFAPATGSRPCDITCK